MSVNYDNLLELTKEYLGPAADRFLARQLAFHLKKKPGELTSDDVLKLAEWVKVSIAILTEDKSMVKEFDEKVKELNKTRHE